VPFPVDVRFVRQAEAKLGRPLPLGYVARLCRQYGGEARVGRDVFSLYPVLDTTDRKRLIRTCNDIARETASARRWPTFPPGALAIADNGGGDKLVLLPDPRASGSPMPCTGGTTRQATCTWQPTPLRTCGSA
jgi:hypothetical protein